MPNYYYCTLSFEGDETTIAQIRESIAGVDEQGKNIPLDFNKIIPMPESLNVPVLSDAQIIYKRDHECKPLAGFEWKRLRELSEHELSEASKLAEQYHNNLTEHGYLHWYDWAIEHWGTKWNACYHDTDQVNLDSIEFMTAWSPPLPVMKVLSEKYPNVDILLCLREEEESEEETKYLLFRAGQAYIEEP